MIEFNFEQMEMINGVDFCIDCIFTTKAASVIVIAMNEFVAT